VNVKISLLFLYSTIASVRANLRFFPSTCTQQRHCANSGAIQYCIWNFHILFCFRPSSSSSCFLEILFKSFCSYF
jgi:hypothetical protein